MHGNHEIRWSMENRLNTYRSNAQGFRSERDFDHPPPAMVGLTGDSFTWGTGVDYDETFGNLLEKRLPGSAVFNFAMPGFGVDQMWMSVRHQLLPLRPVLVVVAFIDEDFDRSLTAYRQVEGFNKPRFILDEGRLRQQIPEDMPNGFMRMLQSRSRLWKIAAAELENVHPFGEWWALTALSGFGG